MKQKKKKKKQLAIRPYRREHEDTQSASPDEKQRQRV
jgi:hypothetical protein